MHSITNTNLLHETASVKTSVNICLPFSHQPPSRENESMLECEFIEAVNVPLVSCQVTLHTCLKAFRTP